MTTCAPCVFGAVSTNTLTYSASIGYVEVQVIPHVSFVNNATVTSLSTSTVIPATANNEPTITISTVPTWTTLGTTLTWPTTYLEYVAFAGAAAPGTGCAESLSPTPINVATLPPASLIYPSGDANLPPALLGYLDSAGIPAQLNNDQLTTCGPLVAPLSAVTGQLTSATTVRTTTPPFTSSTTVPFTSLSTVSSSSGTATVFVSTVTPVAVISSGSVTVSVTAQLVSLGSSKSSTIPPLSSILSSLSSKLTSMTSAHSSSQTGIFTNTTSKITTPRGTISPTASKVSSGFISKTSGITPYTGAAVHQAPLTSNSLVADLMGLVAFVFFL